MVRETYQRTDIGLIPNDWRITKLENVATVYRGGSPRPIQNYITSMSDGINWIKIGDVKAGDKYIFKTEEKIIPSGVSCSRRVYAGDFILSNSMSFGRPYILKIDGCIHDGWLTIQNFTDVFDIDYFYYLLSANSTMNQYISMAAGSSVKNLNKEKVSSLLVTIPPLEEQKAIATALSDVDELIANLEKLIEKKKAIKQGTMQALLTGKKRLPGFSGEWKEHTIGKCGYLQKGSINPQTVPEQYFSEYSMPAFDNSKEPAKVQGKTMHSNRTVISGKVLLFNKLNVRQKRIWLIDNCEDNAVCSAEFLPYSSDIIDLKLLSQILYTDKVTTEFIGMSTGSSNSQKRITPKSFLDYSLYLPTDIEEQKALAEVFSDMDIEIDQLRSKLDKYRLVKQGMMQKLLTGEIRLV